MKTPKYRIIWIPTAFVLFASLALMLRAQEAAKKPDTAVAQTTNPSNPVTPTMHTSDERKANVKTDAAALKKRLTPEQFNVTCQDGTEPPFRNAYWNEHRAGLYVDVITGEPLFTSMDKFESGTGWPSFTKPIAKENVVEHTDRTLGMARTEVRSKSSDAHLGHVFDDGPSDKGGMRYCMNSASLRFIPAEKLEAEGYGKYKSLFEPKK